MPNKQFKRIKHKRLLPIKSKAFNGLLPSIRNIKAYNLMPHPIRPLRPRHSQLHIPTLDIILPLKSHIHHVEFWFQVVRLHDSICYHWDYWEHLNLSYVVLSLLCCGREKGDQSYDVFQDY